MWDYRANTNRANTNVLTISTRQGRWVPYLGHLRPRFVERFSHLLATQDTILATHDTIVKVVDLEPTWGQRVSLFRKDICAGLQKIPNL